MEEAQNRVITVRNPKIEPLREGVVPPECQGRPATKRGSKYHPCEPALRAAIAEIIDQYTEEDVGMADVIGRIDDHAAHIIRPDYTEKLKSELFETIRYRLWGSGA